MAGLKASKSYQVYQDIFAKMASGELREGERLPTEAELCAAFDVSRPIVREALARLRDDALIESRRGSGSYVRQSPNKAILRFAALTSIADMQRCFEFRIGLEGEAAYLAAKRVDKPCIKQIRAKLAKLEAALSEGVLGANADFEFHLSIAEATENRFYVNALENLQESITAGINITRNLSLLRPAARLRQVQQEHVDLVAAIEAGQPDEAKRLMRTHLESAKARVFEGIDKVST